MSGSNILSSTTTSVIGAVSIVALYLWIRRKPTQSYPPGPKPIPLLGNIADLTAKELWLPALQWAKEFGDITYLHVLGQGLVFINSPEAAFELLEKVEYSDKPSLVMCGELCGCANMIAFTGYGDQSRRQRTIMQKAFSPSQIKTYHPLIEIETKALMQRLLADPLDYLRHIRRYTGGIILLTVYGYQVTSNRDKFLLLAEECVNLLANDIAGGAGLWPVDIFPSLKRIPLWMPGSGFKHKAKKWKAKMEEFVDLPYEWLKTTIDDGTAVPSYCSTTLDGRLDAKADPNFEFDLKWTANSMYSASMDSTMTVVSHFILAMLQNPTILAKAAAEIESVVGTDRLPAFSDRPNLPYIDAIMSETFRWSTPVPLNLPHRLMEDDIYKGMFIPKGSLIFGNIWAITRNEEIFPDPETFRPERYLEKVDESMARKRNPRNYVFGFGRRRCPGNHFVESSIWLLIANFIATMDIKKTVDAKGKPIEPVVAFNNAVFRQPDPFPCDFQPRSEKVLNLLSEEDI